MGAKPIVRSHCQRGADDCASRENRRAHHAKSPTSRCDRKTKGLEQGRITGQKRPLLPKQVWAICARLELARSLRDLALFNVAIDSELRGCDLLKLAVADLVKDDRVPERASVIQGKPKRPVQFEPTKNTRHPVQTLWSSSIQSLDRISCLLPSFRIGVFIPCFQRQFIAPVCGLFIMTGGAVSWLAVRQRADSTG